MTNQKLNEAGFIVLFEEKSIEPITYREYLNKYGQDLTTSPNGIADRLHIREVKESSYLNATTDDIIPESTYDEFPERIQANYERYYQDITVIWQFWTWGVGGNNPEHCGPDFDNEEDADLYSYDRAEYWVREKNWHAPIFHDTMESAIQDMANIFDKPVELIERYLAITKITARKASEHL